MQKMIGKYLLVQEIGQGQFGKVFKALDTQDGNREYAVKVVSREKVQSTSHIYRLFQSEIQIMKRLDHPNLLRLVDFLETASNLYVVVQYCPDGDLEKWIQRNGRLDEIDAVFFLKQIMSGFLFLHTNKIMHRDFKVANLFLDGRQIIIGDFGFAKAGVEMASTKLGTPYNMAPEIIFSTGKTFYNSKADLWSIGVVYYQMVCGVLPFLASDMSQLKQMIVQKSGRNLSYPPDVILSQESLDLLRGLLEANPMQRLNWREFFNHPLFMKFAESPLQRNSLASHGARMDPSINQLDGSFVYGDPLRASLHRPNPQQIPARASIRDTIQEKVEESFLREKKAVNQDIVFASNFEIPNAVELLEIDPQVNIAVPQLSRQASEIATNSGEESHTFLTHERNKCLLVLQTSKRWRELGKEEKLRPKWGPIYLIAFSLCRKGLLQLEGLHRTLSTRTDLYKIPGFAEFCNSPAGEKLLTALQEDRQLAQQFYQHLDMKLSDPGLVILGLDSEMLQQVRHISSTEGFLDSVIEKLLVHLLAFERNTRPQISAGIRKATLITGAYTHYALNLNYEFPLRLATQAGGVFGWKAFSDGLESMPEDRIQDLLKKYNKVDELNPQGCFVFGGRAIFC
jgi:serine/threonine protein kinase